MSTHNWLTLTDYSAKYRVSLSTLRRRIKAGELEHKFSEGKYLLKDGPQSIATTAVTENIAPPSSVNSTTASNRNSGGDEDQFWRTTQSLLNEIKKAYSLILQEKEEQILQLKDEVADLKTLVRVLEDDNTRLKTLPPRSIDFDLGLDV